MLSTPNFCQIRKRTGMDIYGQGTLATAVTEQCAIVRHRIESRPTLMRETQSASQGYAFNFAATNKFLLRPATIAEIDDQIIVNGVLLRIAGKHPRWDVFGKLDHYEIEGAVWS